MLRISAGSEDYHEYYRLSNKNYYHDLHPENNATTEQIETAFKELEVRLHLDKSDGNECANSALKRIHTAYEVLTDPIRRTQYDNDLWVKMIHLNGQGIGSKTSEEARFGEIRSWSYQEGERQRAKERAERRAREKALVEVDQEEVQGLGLEREIDRRQAELESLRHEQQVKEKKRRGVRAEQERRAEDQRSRKRQITELLHEKLAAEVKNVQAEERRALFEEEKARKIEETRPQRKRAANERDMGERGRPAAVRKQTQETLESKEAG